jgi:hypothetical protein
MARISNHCRVRISPAVHKVVQKPRSAVPSLCHWSSRSSPGAGSCCTNLGEQDGHRLADGFFTAVMDGVVPKVPGPPKDE